MWAVDTNVLVRVLVRTDDDRQTVLAQAWMRERILNGERIFVSIVVFIETLWVLRSNAGLTHREVHEAASVLAGHSTFIVEAVDEVQMALARTQEKPSQSTDAIAAYFATRAGATGMVTFVRKAVRDAGMVLLTEEVVRGR